MWESGCPHQILRIDWDCKSSGNIFNRFSQRSRNKAFLFLFMCFDASSPPKGFEDGIVRIRESSTRVTSAYRYKENAALMELFTAESGSQIPSRALLLSLPEASDKQ